MQPAFPDDLGATRRTAFQRYILPRGTGQTSCHAALRARFLLGKNRTIAVRRPHGLADGLARFSVGIEDIDDLLRDLDSGLAAF